MKALPRGFAAAATQDIARRAVMRRVTAPTEYQQGQRTFSARL